MFIRFKNKTTLAVCAYHAELQRWGAGVSQAFAAGAETEVSLLRRDPSHARYRVPGRRRSV